jgi:hypothetical protein
MLALEVSIILLLLILPSLCGCGAICNSEKNPRFTRCPTSILLGVDAGWAHAPSQVLGLYV